MQRLRALAQRLDLIRILVDPLMPDAGCYTSRPPSIFKVEWARIMPASRRSFPETVEMAGSHDHGHPCMRFTCHLGTGMRNTEPKMQNLATHMALRQARQLCGHAYYTVSGPRRPFC